MRLATIVAFLALSGTALATPKGIFTQNVTFVGPNPSNVRMSIYEPPVVQAMAPLLVASHWCFGNAQQAYAYFAGLPELADQMGFPIIYPDTPHDTHCFDVTSVETNKHNGGGDSQGIVSMVKSMMKKYKSDPGRIFAMGFSSGAMMTEVLLAAYPEVFAAGSAVSGVAFGCCVDPNGTPAIDCPACAAGNITHTGPQWAQIVKNAYPDYKGYRPKLQIWHGVEDPILNIKGFDEEVKEWSSVFGISANPVETDANTPVANWTKTVYGKGELQAYKAGGEGHGVPIHTDLIAEFFDLNCPAANVTCFHRPDEGIQMDDFKGKYTEDVRFDGPNPTGVKLSVYEPPNVKPHAPLLVALHWCGASAAQAFAYYRLQDYADKYGFPVLYPDTPHLLSHCWDVTSKETNIRNAGGDSLGIASLTNFMVKMYNSDVSRIFVTGFSSGGMMTEVLMATYPDIYAAGATFSGVEFGCCVDPDEQAAVLCIPCAAGMISHTGEEWAQMVKAAFLGYKGYRPKLQIFHGTADHILSFHNFGEEIKEWTTTFNISSVPVQTVSNTPLSGWTKTVYGSGEFEAYSAEGVDHVIPLQMDLVMKFFDLACAIDNPACFHRPDVALYNWCGGKTYKGPTKCAQGVCKKFTDVYSQCVPA